MVNLSNAVNAAIPLNTKGQGVIMDDDPVPIVTINDVNVTEGNSGSKNALFTVTLSAASGRTVTVKYATANGTATAGSDYTAIPTTALTFLPGETTKTVTVKVIGDVLNEAPETFKIVLQSASFGAIVDNKGVGTIVNDDPLPALAVSDAAAVTEGNTGSKNALFTVKLAPISGRTVTINYATANGTATAGSDYTATSGTLTFQPGQTSKTVPVPVLGDVLDETNETFKLNLGTTPFATITDGQGISTITDDDPRPSLTINDVTQAEGNSGTTNFAFTVTLSTVSGQPVTVAYATADGTAVKLADYTAKSGTLAFAPGETSKIITVAVKGDTTVEANETFFVNLSGAVAANLADAQGKGIITNDDMAR